MTPVRVATDHSMVNREVINDQSSMIAIIRFHTQPIKTLRRTRLGIFPIGRRAWVDRYLRRGCAVLVQGSTLNSDHGSAAA
jgi:hypothetical protein